MEIIIILVSMRFRYYLYLFVFCGIISLNSCITTSIVPIRVYNPSEVKFPDSTYHITLVNRLYFPTGNESYIERDSIDSLVINNIAQKNLFKGVEDALYSSELIDKVTIVQKTREDKNTLNFDIELEPLNWDTIGAISDRNRSDVVISLDGLIVKHFYSTKVVFDIDLYNSNLFYKIGILKVYLSALFRVYDPEKKHLIEKYHYSDTIFWESEGKTLHSALRNLPLKKNAVSEAAYWSGLYYAERFISHWEEVDRFYFIRGHPDLKEAAILAKEEKWLDAAKIWKVLAYGPDNEIASSAALNMALVSEMNDNLDAALNWAKKSYSLNKKESVEQYLKVLVERIRLYKKYVWTEE
ncbi:MAG: hypothetical protein IMY71_01205 [Bacteroidetes bacterium]|nr:hypothetical protein [Bacteroidota bacterium]